MLPPSQEVSHMPTDSLLVAVCVVAMFVVFGAVLFWGDLQTRTKDMADSSHGKRRAFWQAEPSGRATHLRGG
jgi:hypothetical protein